MKGFWLRHLAVGLLLVGVVFATLTGAQEEVCEFKLAASWEPPPVYHGNHFAPGGVGAAYWWVYEPLFYYIPLAERYYDRLGVYYEETPEALTVMLRKGVTWHDGTPFTSRDVWTTFMIGYLKKWEVWKYLESVETPDEYRVVFRWKVPTPFGLKLVVAEPIKWPYHIYGEFAERVDITVPVGEEPNVSVAEDLLEFKPPIPIGTGPFMMEEPPTRDTMILVKYPEHYLATLVDFDQVVILNHFGTNEPWWAFLRAGLIDAGHPATAKDLWEEIMAAQPGMKMAFPSDLAGFCLAFNLRETLPDGRPNPFRELKFRQAIAYAIDRAKLAEVTYWAGLPITDYATGLLESMRERWVPREWMEENLTDYSYDPEKAAQLLEELGYRRGPDGIWEDAEGKDLKFGLVCHAGYSDWVLAIDNIASQLKEFGIIIEPETRPGAVYWKSIRAGEFDLCMEWSMTSWRYAHPWAELRRTLHKDGDTGKTVCIDCIDMIGPEGVPVDTTALVDQLGGEFDVEKQKELIKTLAWIHNENLPVLPFVEKRLMIYHLEGVRVTGWPHPESALWYLGPGGIERLYNLFITEGIIRCVR